MGIKLVIRLCLGLSHLRKHKHKHNFQYMLNPLCNGSIEVESSTRFLLQCFSYINDRCNLMNSFNRINQQISETSLKLLANTLLFEHSPDGDKTNTNILKGTIDYIGLTKRFEEPLFWTKFLLCFHLYFWKVYHNLYRYKFQHIFFRLPLNFILRYFNYNSKISVSYLRIVSFSCILLIGGWSMNQEEGNNYCLVILPWSTWWL